MGTFIRLCGLAFVVTTGAFAASAESLDGKYNLYLYFGDTAAFTDTLTLETDKKGEITGEMQVPNDFDGKISKARFKDNRLSFQLLIPKNASRPVDLLFQYDLEAFPKDSSKMVGFAKIVESDGKADPKEPYVGSVVLFRQ